MREAANDFLMQKENHQKWTRIFYWFLLPPFPNPVNVKVGDTITWTNNDNSSPAFHTVTSGLGPNDTNLGKVFDSGLSGPTALTAQGKTFSHTFVTGGEFPYFCLLHPSMIGKVVVTK